MDKKALWSLFENVKAEHASGSTNVMTLNREKNSEVLIVDGTNNYIKSWCVVPTLNANGEHVGGITGFLNSMGYAIKLLKPTRVIIVFDGKGGSARRRAIYPKYKASRKAPRRLNRTYEGMVDESGEEKALLMQMGVLADFLTALPVSVIVIDHIEADDTIAYIANHVFSKPTERVTIMSSDKDYYQLVSDRVSVWSPIKKKVYDITSIINEFGIHPNNFINFRIMDGDTSDEIDGVRGIGLATAVKRFPMLTEATRHSVDDIVKFANERVNEYAAYAAVAKSADILDRNHQLMQLAEPIINGSTQMRISDAVDKKYTLSTFAFIQKLTQYSMHQSMPNYHVWLREVFGPLSQFS